MGKCRQVIVHCLEAGVRNERWALQTFWGHMTFLCRFDFLFLCHCWLYWSVACFMICANVGSTSHGKMRMCGCGCRTCKMRMLVRILMLILTLTLTLTLILTVILALNRFCRSQQCPLHLHLVIDWLTIGTCYRHNGSLEMKSWHRS